MIQVCSRCGTRWNVRDRQRVWCPRCNGTLLAPSAAPAPPAPPAPSQWSARPTAPAVRPTGQGAQNGLPRLPAGYRWIAVRPGAAPPARRRQRNLGPTPRYVAIPRWGLVERFDAPELDQQVQPRSGPSITALRATLIATIAALGLAALVHIARYALLIINRSVLLNPVVAWSATWFGILVSVAALFLLFATFVLLTNWLIARRSVAFKHVGRQEHRPLWALRAGCLVPIVNLAWAPVFVLELASVEGILARLRRPIAVWWTVWVLSTVVSLFAIATSFTSDAQGIADNTVTTIVGYLIATATMVLVGKVLMGFERRPVEKPAKRWVIVADESCADSGIRVEAEGQNPAA
ncbi:DUF4328 domain-containing protein [Mycolicibacterium stellerae]|uniref:DUF4328 domain-containing protein n=1 Tax=Mycolicibacterium stellerae TaxID=2358193 RepID=UPI000F0BD2C1|nr:DUF4328 domain-containing protein [Mycolicibacterium stellerae]